jgi:hypothetical protein
MQSVNPWAAETGHRPGARLIWASTLGLAVLALATFYVSFRAQFTDVAMVVCSLLALGMACAGQSAKVARLLVVVFAGLSAGMNYLAADVASFRSVAVYVMPPAVFAVCTDQVVSVVRRHGLGIAEDSAWSALGRVVLAALKLSGVIVLYSLRFVLAPGETARGLRQMVLTAAALPEATRQGRPGTAAGTVPQVLREAAPEVVPHPVLEAVPDIQERSPVSPGKQPGPATPERLAEFYAADLAEGRVPSKRQIKREWPVGYETASELHDELAARAAP